MWYQTISQLAIRKRTYRMHVEGDSYKISNYENISMEEHLEEKS